MRTKPITQKYVGQIFGNWEVIGRSQRRGYAKVKCECGTVKEVRLYTLKNGTSTNCGCLKKRKKEKHIGEQFGYWTVIGQSQKKKCVKAKCICGNIKDIFLNSLQSGSSKSCGCKKNLLRVSTNKSHGIKREIKKMPGNKEWHKLSDYSRINKLQNGVAMEKLVTTVFSYNNEKFNVEYCSFEKGKVEIDLIEFSENSDWGYKVKEAMLDEAEEAFIKQQRDNYCGFLKEKCNKL